MQRRIFFSKQSIRIGVILLLLLIGFVFRSFVGRTLQFIQIPIASAATWLTRHVGFQQDLQGLSKESIVALQEDRVKYLALQMQCNELSREHEQLKKTLRFVEGRSVLPVGASVLSRTTTNEQALLILNRGTDDGVFVGAPVVVEEGLYVGKVIEAGKTQSVVSTITDRSHATAVSLLNQTETIGMIRGYHGNLALLEFIPIEEVIEVDNIAVTSGLEEHVPSGLLVGLVNTVRSDPDGPFQEAIIEPLVDTRRYSKFTILVPLEL